MKMMLSEYSAKIHEKAIREESECNGRTKEQLSSIRNLMKNLGLSADKAMTALDIPMEKRNEYAEQL